MENSREQEQNEKEKYKHIEEKEYDSRRLIKCEASFNFEVRTLSAN